MKPRLNKINIMSIGLAAFVVVFAVGVTAYAEHSNIQVRCPEGTDLHPDSDPTPGVGRDSAIKCAHLTAGDGFVTMADDAATPLYIFSFGTLPDEVPSAGMNLGDAIDPIVENNWYQIEYPGKVMTDGMLQANGPAPTISVDEDDEFFLSLTNVGMALRPDLFDPHTVHWHGFPQASSLFDGVPDASISINMGATLTYYYNAKDAGTYMYHCHVEATEHMQMGMLGNLYVRPRQNKLADLTDLDGFTHHDGYTYAYNDGDGSTYYDVDYPIQIGSFDPDFHNASFSVQPLPFAAMKDRYFLLNGRGYPDTVEPGIISWGAGGLMVDSQPVSSLIEAEPNQKILLRISNLNVTQFNTLASSGIPMKVVGLDARLLRDDDSNNMYYTTNSVTLGGGMSADVILDTSGLIPGQTFFLYTTNLNNLANDDENFGGQMTEIRINAPTP